MSGGADSGLNIAWRLKAGAAMFALSILVPAAGVPVAISLGLPATIATAVSGASLIAGEALGIAAVAIMGRAGYLQIKTWVTGILKRRALPGEVTRARYNLGLVLFCMPLLFAWLSVYTADFIPGFRQNPLPYAIGGDFMLLASLFVLGGRFWDKLRSLFVHDALAQFPRARERSGINHT